MSINYLRSESQTLEWNVYERLKNISKSRNNFSIYLTPDAKRGAISLISVSNLPVHLVCLSVTS